MTKRIEDFDNLEQLYDKVLQKVSGLNSNEGLQAAGETAKDEIVKQAYSDLHPELARHIDIPGELTPTRSSDHADEHSRSSFQAIGIQYEGYREAHGDGEEGKTSDAEPFQVEQHPGRVSHPKIFLMTSLRLQSLRERSGTSACSIYRTLERHSCTQAILASNRRRHLCKKIFELLRRSGNESRKW
jgi:hypothetical protein